MRTKKNDESKDMNPVINPIPIDEISVITK